jgi:hypothetical protein
MDVGLVARIMGESDGRFLPAVVATLRTHPDFGSYVRLVAGKLAAVFHWYEQPNNANFYFFRLHAAALRYAWVTFAVVGPLGLVGMGLAARRLKAAWPLYAMVPSLLATMCILWVISRFRAPLLAILIPFAGLTVAQVVTWVLDKRLLPALVAVCAVTFLAVWMSRPLPAEVPVIRADDYLASFDVYYDPAERAARKAGDWRRAAEVLEQGLSHVPPVAEEEALATRFAAAYRRHAEALRMLAQPQAADAQDRRAAILEAATQPARR